MILRLDEMILRLLENIITAKSTRTVCGLRLLSGHTVNESIVFINII